MLLCACFCRNLRIQYQLTINHLFLVCVLISMNIELNFPWKRTVDFWMCITNNLILFPTINSVTYLHGPFIEWIFNFIVFMPCSSTNGERWSAAAQNKNKVFTRYECLLCLCNRGFDSSRAVGVAVPVSCRVNVTVLTFLATYNIRDLLTRAMAGQFYCPHFTSLSMLECLHPLFCEPLQIFWLLGSCWSPWFLFTAHACNKHVVV